MPENGSDLLALVWRLWITILVIRLWRQLNPDLEE